MSSGGRHVSVRGYNRVLAHLMFGMTVLAASQLMRLIVPPVWSGLVSFIITGAALTERRSGQTRPKFDENTESETAPTPIRPRWPLKSRQLSRAQVGTNFSGLAPIRTAQSFESGSPK